MCLKLVNVILFLYIFEYNYLFYFFNLYLNQFFAKKLNLYDLPNKNKIHNIKTPLTGGIYFISIIIISFIIDLFFNAEPLKEKFIFC